MILFSLQKNLVLPHLSSTFTLSLKLVQARNETKLHTSLESLEIFRWPSAKHVADFF